jgi:hypothetical protein
MQGGVKTGTTADNRLIQRGCGSRSSQKLLEEVDKDIPYLTHRSCEGTISTMDSRDEVLLVFLVHQGMEKASPSITILVNALFFFDQMLEFYR